MPPTATACSAVTCNSISGRPSRSSACSNPAHPWGRNVILTESSGVRSAKLSSVRVSDDDDEDYDEERQLMMATQIMERLEKYKSPKQRKGLFRRSAANLGKLDLSGLGLNMVHAAAVEEMQGVLSLDLSKNDPMLVVPDTLVQNSPRLASLQHLDFSKCQILILPEDWDLPNLLTLDLSYNRIRDFPSQTFLKGIPLLRELNLKGNRLTHIPSFRAVQGGRTPGHTTAPLSLTRSTSNSALTARSDESRGSRNNGNKAKQGGEYRAVSVATYNASLLTKLLILNVGCNDLTFLPDHLPQNLKTLIACNNYLSQVPSTLLLGDLDEADDDGSLPRLPPLKELVVSSNPLKEPPLVVCEAGMKSMRKYFQQQKTQQKHVVQ